MAPDPMNPAGYAPSSEPVLKRLLGGMSVFIMLMTIPQVPTIWIGHQAAGVSVVSWSAYLLSALLWFCTGFKNETRTFTCRVLDGLA